MSSLRNIPPVDEVLKNEKVQGLVTQYNRQYIVDLIRIINRQLRQEITDNDAALTRSELLEIIISRLEECTVKKNKGTLCRVINGTGIILHTNLGRAPLGQRAIDYAVSMSGVYNNLEMDLDKGQRGSRYGHVEELLQELTGAEAALVVNNNAAAVMLGLNTMASGREVIVSRGQLIEIGGAFRVPEVMKLSGARLIETGTTNRTYLSDYEDVITPETALLFTAHTSNYKIVGFVHEVPLAELVSLGRERDIPVMQDLGSGSLCDLSAWGLGEEPTVQSCLEAGADIICFSGDKLLGGPQAGILVGSRKWIAAMKKNQLLRALRVDKLTIAALEGTLLEYRSGKPCENLPVLKMISQKGEDLNKKAEDLAGRLNKLAPSCPGLERATVITVDDMVGGGSYPIHKMRGFGVEIKLYGVSIEGVAGKLRRMDPAVLVRRQEESLIISARTLFNDDLEIIPGQLHKSLEEEK